MKHHLDQAIAALEQELATHVQSVSEIETALSTLRRLASSNGHAPRLVREPSTRRRSVKRRSGALRNGRTDGRTEQKPGRRGASLARRSLPKTGIHRQAILDILRAKSPQSPGELMKRAGFENLATLRYQLKPLVKEGLVTVTGATMNRQISLGRARAAKEAP